MRKESKDAKRTLSLHRLVQKEYSYFVKPDERQKRFDDASLLLLKAFPERVGSRFLHSKWPVCEMYYQHVASLLERWQESRDPDQDYAELRAPNELCHVITNFAW